MIRVAVADDDDVFRRALVDVLVADSRFQVVVQVATGEGLEQAVLGARADLLLLDVRMPGGGPAGARAVVDAAAASGHELVVVAMSADSGVPVVVSMVRAGALGFLVKGQIGSALPELLLRCLVGELVLAGPRAAEVLRELDRPASGLHGEGRRRSVASPSRPGERR